MIGNIYDLSGRNQWCFPQFQLLCLNVFHLGVQGLDPIKIMGNVYLIYLELMLHPRNQSWIRTVSITYLIYENSNSLSVLISHKSCVLNPVPKSGIQKRQKRLWKRVDIPKKYLYDIPYFGLTQITRFIFDLIQYVCVWRSPHNRNKTDPYM